MLLASLLGSKPVGASAQFRSVCQEQWSACVQRCNNVDIIEKVVSAAFEVESGTAADFRSCQQQLLAKRSALKLLLLLSAHLSTFEIMPAFCSLHPALNDHSACQLLQKCLLRGPLSSLLSAYKMFTTHIDHCIIDLSCTSVQGAQGMLVRAHYTIQRASQTSACRITLH